MSADEVIEMIKKLSHQEQLEVLEYVSAAKAKGEFGTPPSNTVNEGFKRVADEVFTTNDKLFRKLAE